MWFLGRIWEKNYVADSTPWQSTPGNSSEFFWKIAFHEDDIYVDVGQFFVYFEEKYYDVMKVTLNII